MELISIGEAARRLGLTASALRYYEDRGLVSPAARRSGRRLYGPEQLHRLAFIDLMRQIGVGLDTVSTVLDGSDEQWRTAIAEQIEAFDDLIGQMTKARSYLDHMLYCPAERPVQQCPSMIRLLDLRLSGADAEELAAEMDSIPQGRIA